MKKLFYITALSLFIINATDIFSAEIAVLPYKIVNAGQNFPVDAGNDYAKLISVGSAVKKGLNIYPAFQLGRDLKSFGIDPEITVTESQVGLLAKSRLIDYIITGSVLKTENGYSSKSVLYSASAGKVINTCSVKADTIENLAEKEIDSLFMFIPDISVTVKSENITETLIVADTSIMTSFELTDLKNKLPEIYTSVKYLSPESTIYFTNFPSKQPQLKQIRSLSDFEGIASKLTNSGKISSVDYEDILNKGISTIQWKKNSARNIIFITNSDISRTARILQLSTAAQNKKIRISHILLSSVSQDSSNVYNSISVKTGGFIKDITYHQRIVDGHGEEFHLYYERGRLFISELNPSEWKNGILKYSGNSREYNIKKDSYAEEINIRGRSAQINASSLDKYYRQYGERTVISSGKTETNFEYTLTDFAVDFLDLKKNSPAAKVLLSQFNTSIWVDLYSKSDIEFFRNAAGTGRSVLIGMTVYPDANTTYGIAFGSRIFTSFSFDDIPFSLKTDFNKVISDKKKYINNGFMSPPVWFFDVKIEKFIETRDEQDIRN